jgi:putative alpha-1,2-mannosidase
MRDPNKASLAWLLAGSLLLSGSRTRPGARILLARSRSGIAALAAMVKGGSDPDAHEQLCPEWDNLSDYLRHGYLGPDTIRSDKLHSGPSQTLEFTTADFSIARFAQAIGDTTTYRTFMKRAQFWKNIFDPRTGYIAPRRLVANA